jgi:beta-lactamase superfamily II metal-dependent hydrolase
MVIIPPNARSSVEWLPDEQRMRWRLWQPPPAAAHNLRLDDNTISLLAEADTGGGIVVMVEAERAFDLEIDTGFTTFLEHVPAGSTRYLLTYLDRTDVRRVDGG